ncbi:MAG: hypothetical protein O3C10_01080 [Chloroflexi bacterium]|nr:hypothetical protein [Chloroflexota bacterium]
MVTRVLVPVDSTTAAVLAYKEVRAALRDDPYVVFLRVLTPGEESLKARARASLVKCLMVYRTRGVDSEMQLIEAETVAKGIADATTRFEIDEIMCIQGHGADDPSGVVADLGSLTGVPVRVMVGERETATAG